MKSDTQNNNLRLRTDSDRCHSRISSVVTFSLTKPVHNNSTEVFSQTFHLTTAARREHAVEILELNNTNLVGRFSPHLASFQAKLGPD